MQTQTSICPQALLKPLGSGPFSGTRYLSHILTYDVVKATKERDTCW